MLWSSGEPLGEVVEQVRIKEIRYGSRRPEVIDVLSASPLTAPSLVFVACVEPGRLEAQTVLLCRSIRRFAGRHRDARIVAVQPRRGGELRPDTRSALADARWISLGWC